jgi:CheY-like chemotaxis protein
MPIHREAILIVDDEAVIRDLTAEMLGHVGYQVLAAPSGAIALETVVRRPKPFDLVLTAIAMPHMAGPELAAFIVSLVPGIRVLYMSGQPRAALAGYHPTGDMPPLVAKPFSESTLLRAVRTTLDAPSKCRSTFGVDSGPG